MEKQNSFVRFMLLFGIMLIVTQLAMRWLGLVPEVPPVEENVEQPAEVVSEAPILVGDQQEAFIALGSYDPLKNEKYLQDARFVYNSFSCTLIQIVIS